jgi:nucleoside-diphosphate-sugar epimerase
MKTVLILGASGFVGEHLTRALLAEGYAIRCLTRDAKNLTELADEGCEIIEGDISDFVAVQQAVESCDAVYISIHTLSPQPSAGDHPHFMDIEMRGIKNVITACQLRNVSRVVYLTSLGIGPDEKSEWLSERWKAEELLLSSGLDATVVHPGIIIGMAGRGFNTVVTQSRRRIAVTMAGEHPKMRGIAIDDLVYYLVGMLEDTRTFNKRYDVGNEEVLSMNEMIDILAEMNDKRPPIKIQIPEGVLNVFAPFLGKIAKFPQGAVRGFIDALEVDSIGDPLPIRTLLPRRLMSFREAAKRAMETE